MKKTRLYLLLAFVAAASFVLGLSFDSLFTKSYADERKTDLLLPDENAFETMSTGTTSRADYEIVTIYGRKYIIFSSGGDIEVLNY
jgi:hypothetical protein